MSQDREQASRYRNRASEIRIIAESFRDKNTKRILTGVADDYDRMARSWDAVAASDVSRAPQSGQHST